MTRKEWIAEALKTVRGTHDRGVNLTDVEKTLEALCDVAAAELIGGGEVSLPGLGKLKAARTAERTGHNPRTGEPVTIPARNKVRFVAGKDFKAALNAEL